ncbi:hypothetical protein G4Y79_00550 [Phototrophicus methaneseepsis]|uniref:Tetratricopeptide repeat protein n=1 Tax=Phototrophicus methaneseepsis TaxID=2710758 RepID=A0A7S8E9U0_9CHLR|nr:hypothetical protein [Phototrophicus methaneseepsis]QPC82894.1 hypothetical protein G4Y79_00550 [Phototrophicus methaneseepsis]
MSDTPDFDNMSPEEMMRWMESLAKRQGVDPSSLTTDADMEVEEVSEDDERLGETGEYIPYGWTKEKWDAHLAQEAAEKAARQAATPPASIPDTSRDEEHTKPMYTPEPIAGLDDEFEERIPDELSEEMPDFEDMSPEEAMRWMESLAKRQGADPSSFLTEADMDVEEVAEDDERLSATGEYIPYGWTAEKWQAHLAKEAADKAAKQVTSQQDDDLLPSFEDIDDLDYESADEDYELVSEYDDDLTYDVDDDDFPSDFDEEDAIDLDEQVMEVDADEFLMDEEADEYEEEPQPLWSTVGAPDEELGEEFSLADLTTDEEDYYDDEDESEAAATAANPMSWLQELAGDEEVEELDLSALESISDEQPAATIDPMSWLAALAEETKGDAVPDLENLDLGDISSNLGDLDALASSTTSQDDEGENPIAWIESLARDQGAPSEELSTSADIEIERPRNFTPDGPGYEPYSFETGGKPIVEEDEEEPDTYLDEEEVESLDMSDPSAWLDSLAAGVGGARSYPQDDEGYDFEDAEEDDFVGEELSAEAMNQDTMSRLNAGEDVSPEEMEDFFDTMFRQAEQFADQDEEYDVEEYEELPSEAIPAEIPDWLQAQMADDTQTTEAISSDMSAEEANAMLESLFGTGETEAVSPIDSDEDVLTMDEAMSMVEEEATLESEATSDLTLDIYSDDFLKEADELDFSDEDLPDWLREDMDEDTSADLADIFASEEDTLSPTPSALSPAAQTFDMPQDTDDTWVQAFEVEADPVRQQELVAWYEQSSHGAAPAALQTAELPLERNVPLGEAEVVPDWLSTAAVSAEPFATEPEFVAPVESEDLVEPNLPNWLTDDETSDDIPDWLKTDSVETVDDEDLPEWLNVDAEVDLEDIPDWLRETMDEDEEVITIDATSTASEAEPEWEMTEEEEPAEEMAPLAPAPQPTAVVPVQEPRSPAPVPVAASQIDVAAILQSARSKISEGDVDSSLTDYETVVRANTALDEVVGDLQKLTESQEQKKNPAVFRVLGDGLMRQGKLQDALETYRKALKML